MGVRARRERWWDEGKGWAYLMWVLVQTVQEYQKYAHSLVMDILKVSGILPATSK